MELVDQGIKGFLGHASAGESQVGASSRRICVSFGSHAQNDAVGAASASREGPVKVGVLITSSNDMVSKSSHDFPFENLWISVICTYIKDCAVMLPGQRPCHEAKSKRNVLHLGCIRQQHCSVIVSVCLLAFTNDRILPDSRAGSSDDLEALVKRGLVDLHALNASTHLDSFALVVLIGPILDLDIFEVMCPQAQSAGSGALAVEVMPGVAWIRVSIVTNSSVRPCCSYG